MEVAPRPSTDRAQAGPRPAHCRARISNKPHRMVIDGRSQLGRRLQDLAESFAAQLGGWAGMSDMLAANVRRAAELSTLAEQTRAEALRAGNVDPLALVRLEGAATRAVRALGLDRLNRDNDDRSLEDYLDTKYDADPTADVPDQPNDIFGAEVAIADDTHTNAPAVDDGNGSDSEAAA